MRSLSKLLWAKISRRGDEKGQFPVQQATYLGRVADFVALFPFGMHANLPPDQLGLVIDEAGRIFLASSAIGRIKAEEGEVVFYHPKTKSRIHFKDSGDIDVETKVDVNIKAKNVSIDASVTKLGVGGNAIARVGDSVQVNVIGGSSSGTHNGTITSGGDNTSI